MRGPNGQDREAIRALGAVWRYESPTQQSCLCNFSHKMGEARSTAETLHSGLRHKRNGEDAA